MLQTHKTPARLHGKKFAPGPANRFAGTACIQNKGLKINKIKKLYEKPNSLKSIPVEALTPLRDEILL